MPSLALPGRITGILELPVLVLDRWDTPLWRQGQAEELIKSALSGQGEGPRVWTPKQAASYILDVASQKNRELETHMFHP